MKIEKREENLIEELSQLYKKRGYKLYKPSSFEEYSLYQENKNFLINKNVITFSDLGGKLMAMRPDVTLSLIRHNDVKSGYVEKYFYNEMVYRQATGGSDFKEIRQIGVEVIGEIDSAVISEVAILICRTLAAVSDEYVLDISHMGFTEGLLNEFKSNSAIISDYIKKKNPHDFYKLAKTEGYSEKLIKAFELAATCNGSAKEVLTEAKKVVLNDGMRLAAEELEKLCDTLEQFGFGDKIKINFSASANADYYNGVIFNGYLKGIPHSVLSGGRYDKLLKKLGKRGGAIGFATYIGEIERYLAKDDDGVDYLILYDALSQYKALRLAQLKIDDGKSVRLASKIPAGYQYKEIVDLTEKEN